jgi:hypothetical protein
VYPGVFPKRRNSLFLASQFVLAAHVVLVTQLYFFVLTMVYTKTYPFEDIQYAPVTLALQKNC